MTAFIFYAPDGSRLVRNSKTRTYTHAIVYCYAQDGKHYRIGSCVGRPDLVAARLEQWGKGSPHCIAVPALPDFPTLARAALCENDDDWGTDRQIAAFNTFMVAAEAYGVNVQAIDSGKHTSDELVQDVAEALAKKLHDVDAKALRKEID